MQSKQRKILVPAVAAAVVAIGGLTTQVFAEGSSSSAEVQQGVPGVDVDLNASRTQGVDVDMQAGNQNDADNGPDTQTLGAGADTGSMGSDEMRAPIQDRN